MSNTSYQSYQTLDGSVEMSIEPRLPPIKEKKNKYPKRSDQSIDSKDIEALIPKPSTFVYNGFNPSNQINSYNPYCVCLYFATFLFAVTLCYAILALTQSFSCLGPPYIYITHKGSRNIIKFSRDGCLIHQKVLWGVSNQNSDLRSMVLGTYENKEALFVADSNSDQSGVMLFGSCFDSTSLRPYLNRIVTSQQNPGAKHAYGLAFDNTKGIIYASFQNTDTVLRYNASSNTPIPNNYNLTSIKVPQTFSETNSTGSLPSKPKKNKNKLPYFDGTFVQFGLPNIHSKSEQGIRSIVWVNNFTEMWIANEDVGSVVIVNSNGEYKDKITIKNPIGLYHSIMPSGQSAVFISCKGDKKGAVYAYDSIKKTLISTFQSIGMKHPTGIISYKDVLFVADQTRNAVITFNISTSRIINLIIPDYKIPGPIEQIALSNC